MFDERKQFISIVLSVGFTLMVRGQDTGTTTTATLPPIRVTASPAETMQPGSMAVLSGDTLSAAEVKSLDQLGQQVPNLVSDYGGTRSFNNTFGMRGVLNTLYYSDPAVAIVVDDVAYPNPGSAALALNSLASVQVLRGSQPSEFGANAPAGAIVVTPLHPSDFLQLDARAGYGTYSAQDYMLHVSGPVIKSTLLMAATFSYDSRDGFVLNEKLGDRPDHQEGYHGRFDLCYQPSDDWQVRVTSDNQHDDDGVQRFTRIGQNPFVGNYDFNGQNRTDENIEALHIAHNDENYTATSITSYVGYEITPSSLDFDFSPIPFDDLFIHYHEQAYTEELKFVSSQEVNHAPQWRAGVYLSVQNLHDNNDSILPSLGLNDTSRVHFVTLQSALYGDVSSPLSDDFVLTAAGRVQLDKRTATLDFLSPFDVRSHEEQDRNFVNAAPKITLAWTGNANIQPYMDTALAYRNGGYSYFQINNFLNNFSSEQTWANEIGVNSTWLNGAVTGNLAGFWNESRNYQLEIYTSGDFGLINAPRVTSRGFELSSTQHLSSWFDLSEGFGFTDARFGTFDFPVTGADDTDHRVPSVPEYNSLIAAEMHHPDGYMFRIEGTFSGTTYFDSENTAYYRQDPYACLNMKLGYEKKNWDLYLVARNLTDTKYRTLEVPQFQVGIPGNPRELGVEIAAHF
jgi:iron complex outermembrane receptor protein